MMAQAKRLTLHFKVPAVLPGSRAQALVLVGISGRDITGYALDAGANRLELADCRFEGSADPCQRCNAFLIELPKDRFVPLG